MPSLRVDARSQGTPCERDANWLISLIFGRKSLVDYNDNETTNDQESTSTTTTTTSTTTTSSTTTTTTTPKPTLTQHFDYRDSRAYDSGTSTQYNGYQAKNDYPPMSAHSVHKWQSLGTRESVKETRSNMQQYNKNGKRFIGSLLKRTKLYDAKENTMSSSIIESSKIHDTLSDNTN
uniref:Uncharacterized protein n=1 Tax=Vespula pensylvanica TaxID=30213 RepID=A0A834NQP1_VESPE|nr:hypothetical protein H0235_012266 [Vespula pensylvanica]